MTTAEKARRSFTGKQVVVPANISEYYQPLLKDIADRSSDQFVSQYNENDRRFEESMRTGVFQYEIDSFLQPYRLDDRERIGVARYLVCWLHDGSPHYYETPSGEHRVRLELRTQAPRRGNLGSIAVHYRFV